MPTMNKHFQWEIIEKALQEPDIGSFLIKIHELAYEELWDALEPGTARVHVNPENAKNIMGVAMKKYGPDAGMPLVNWGFGGDHLIAMDRMQIQL